jgi:hypothetical protein
MTRRADTEVRRSVRVPLEPGRVTPDELGRARVVAERAKVHRSRLRRSPARVAIRPTAPVPLAAGVLAFAGFVLPPTVAAVLMSLSS